MISGIIIPLMLLLGSCNHQTVEQPVKEESMSQVLPNQYATLFEISRKGNATLFKVFHGSDRKLLSSFYMAEAPDPDLPSSCTFVRRTHHKFITLASTQLAYFIALDALHGLVGINSSRFLFNDQIHTMIDSGRVVRVGKEGAFDVEAILRLQPDIIFVSPFKTGGYDVLRELGIPLIPIAAYEEKSPLARAEWMRFIGAIMQCESTADSLFNAIASRYQTLKNSVAQVNYRPRVLSGKMKSGIWYGLGGRSYFANYCRDAGAEYILDNDQVGSQPMDFESMYAKACDADYWRLLVNYNGTFDYGALIREDERYGDFKAFRTHHVIACNMRHTPFYEETPVRPDILLADYIHAFHPQMLPDYQPVYFKTLD